MARDGVARSVKIGSGHIEHEGFFLFQTSAELSPSDYCLYKATRYIRAVHSCFQNRKKNAASSPGDLLS